MDQPIPDPVLEERLLKLEAFERTFKQFWTVSGDVTGHFNVDRLALSDMTDYYRFRQPVSGAGLGIHTRDVTTNGTSSILDKTEAGRLISVGVFTQTAWSVSGSDRFDLYLDLTMDGDTESIQLVFEDTKLGNTLRPWGQKRKLDGSDSWDDTFGDAKHDGILIYFNLNYADHCKVDLRVANSTSMSTGLVAGVVHRAIQAAGA